MSRVVISVAAALIVGLAVISVITYSNRAPSAPAPTATSTSAGFRPLQQGAPAARNENQPSELPYAVPTPVSSSVQSSAAPAQQQTYQPPIVTASPVVFSEPYVQSVQQSPALAEQHVFQQDQYQGAAPSAPPAVSDVQQPSAAYIPVSMPTSSMAVSFPPYTPPASSATGGGGSSGGGSNIGSGIISGLLGCVTGAVAAGPIGCVLGGVLGGLEGNGGILGGLLGGVLGGGVSSLFGGGLGGGGTGNFGGKITNVTYCTCSVALMLDIDDVRGQTISLLYQPGQSTLYEDYNVFEAGPNVLGLYSQGGGQCQVYTGEDCTSEGNPQGTITEIGTSE